MASTVLEVDRLCKSFGGVHAIRDLSFTLSEGEILGLIGPNGSGKSTTVNALAGVYPATSGNIRLAGAAIETLPEYARVAKGLARTFQTASNFTEITVRQQVRLACNVTLKTHPAASIFGFGAVSTEAAEISERVDKILQMTSLAEIANDRVGAISSAEQRFLMIATALAAEPKAILLDEPAAGLIANERSGLAELIRAIRDAGTAVLVIEHHMGLIMEVCDRIVVLNFGAKIAEGTPAEIRNDQAVIDAYLGEAA